MNQSQDSRIADTQAGRNLARIVLHGWASFAHTFFRRDFGYSYGGIATVGFVIFLIYGAVMAERMVYEPFALTCLVWFVASIFHRARAYAADRRRDRPHSYYNGWPLVCDLFKVSEQTAKSFFEPIVVIGVGSVLMSTEWPSIGLFFVLSGICGGLENATINQERRKVVRQLLDAHAEQQRFWDEMNNFGIGGKR